MLAATDLAKQYRGHHAVRGVTLRVEPGRVLGLVGNNGAGKTTTIKMLAGLIRPTTGTARLDGHPTLDAPTRAHLGYLPEDSPIYDEETPLSYLAFFADLYDIPRARGQERARTLLTRLDLDDAHWKRPLGTLSKGMKRKVAIARALLHDPKVLLLDEPTSGLDPSTDAELTRFIRDLADHGKAILLSAHNLPQVEAICDTIHLMHAGRIVAHGTLHDLRQRFGEDRYRVRATVSFPGSRPDGAHHAADLTNLQEVEAALESVRKAHGTILHVESVPPRLDEILRRATAEPAVTPGPA